MRPARNNLPERVAYALFETNWRIRRRVMFMALTYIATCITYILIFGQDTAVNQQAILALIAAGVSIIASYVFGAVWDDNNKRSRVEFNDYGTDIDIRNEAPPVEGGLR